MTTDGSTTPAPQLGPDVVLSIDEFGVIDLPQRYGAANLDLGLVELSVIAELAADDPPDRQELVALMAERYPDIDADVGLLFQRLGRRGQLATTATPRRGSVNDHPEAASVTIAEDPRAELRVRTPLVLRPYGGRYEYVDHDGRVRGRFGPAEVLAIAGLTIPTTIEQASSRLRDRAGAHAPDDSAWESLVARLRFCGALATSDPELAVVAEASNDEAHQVGDPRLLEVFARRAGERDEAEAAREKRTGVRRAKVVPVTFDRSPPLALGLMMAYAMRFKDSILEETYDFRPEFVFDHRRIPALTEHPAVYLFSNYLWSHEQCMEVSDEVKRLSPDSITIHGGPDTPKYEADARSYLANHPSVDIIVRGEGELSCAEVLEALVPVIGDERPDLGVLADVPGVYYRDGDGMATTSDRERIAELDTIPSPFLMGLFDAYGEVPGAHVTIETNRGCPYGCTFCDWGSATMSRIRKFDLDRVYAEMEWCAANGAHAIGPADSNFGIFRRDVEIADKLAELKARYGFPFSFGVSYAKNTVKHLQYVIETMAKAGIVTQGILSLQSMDEATLEAVHRSNIKTEKYDALAAEMRAADLPLFVDLMLGLPGQTPESFRTDLQLCIDREMQVRIPRTTLLVNSPMNDPEYKAEHEIVVNKEPGPGNKSLVVSTATFTRDDYRDMTHTRLVFLLMENFGVARQVARYVRQEAGVHEVDFYEGIRHAVLEDPHRWPALANTVLSGPGTMAPPASWAFYIEDLRDYVISVHGVADDTALDTVMAVQHAMLPAFDRPAEQVLELAHDYAAWFAAVVGVKEGSDRADWARHVPELRSYPPASFRVADPLTVTRAIGCEIEAHGFGVNWEYDSPVRRAFVAKETPGHAVLQA
ncbi:MAG: radical SAM protein [Acidimicrobiia bacterium]|nr:radical SAM protein [Acidimicrobiia bacterium]